MNHPRSIPVWYWLTVSFHTVAPSSEADLPSKVKRPLAQCKNRLVRQPSSSKQPRAKKPRLGTLDTVTRSPTPSFTSSGPLTSIPPQTQASGFFSPVASNDDAPDYIKAKGAVDASSPSTPSVDFYDGEKCCKCRLTLKDESQKDRLELPRVVRSPFWHALRALS